jgi:hyperosmotically inducible protein
MKNLSRVLLVFVLSLLAVSFQAVADNKSDSLKATVGDSVVTAKIKSQFVANNTTKATSINVETNNGVVKLTGVVDSEEEADTAIQIAASTVGAREINTDNLYVKGGPEGQQSNQPFQDGYITAKVKGVLLRKSLTTDLPAKEIIVETKDGVVYLTGEVRNDRQAKHAANLAQSVSGVKQVISKLKAKA